MAIPQAFVTRFLQTITERKFAEAERIFERIKKKMKKNDWNRGYLMALNGMLLSHKSDSEQHTFLSNIDFNNSEELKKYRKEFLKFSRGSLHTDYDRGFFSAWAEYMRVLSKTR
jgi:hypothetical protein